MSHQPPLPPYHHSQQADEPPKVSHHSVSRLVRIVCDQGWKPGELARNSELAAILLVIAAQPNSPLPRPAAKYVEDDPGACLELVLSFETILDKALNNIGGNYGHAAQLLMGMAVGSRQQGLGRRRELAAALLGITGDTFRKQPERRMLIEITAQVYYLVVVQPDGGSDSGSSFEPDDS